MTADGVRYLWKLPEKGDDSQGSTAVAVQALDVGWVLLCLVHLKDLTYVVAQLACHRRHWEIFDCPQQLPIQGQASIPHFLLTASFCLH
jgi:hypothetical protein